MLTAYKFYIPYNKQLTLITKKWHSLCCFPNFIVLKTSKLLLATLVTGLFGAAFIAPQAQATAMTGAITLGGSAIFDTSSLATATRVDAFENVTVTSLSGDFATTATVGESVTMAQPWIFTLSTTTPGLWSVGGFTFDLASSTVVLQNSNFLLITGTGTIFGNGYDPTLGTWSYTSQTPDGDGVFSFSAGPSAQDAPDGGTTVALLGVALAGVEIIRRKLAAT